MENDKENRVESREGHTERDCCVALPHSAMGLSEVCDCEIS